MYPKILNIIFYLISLNYIMVRDNILAVDLNYPRNTDSQINTIQVGLIDVRAADDIQIKYDFDRDGWVVMQASIFEWDVEDTIRDEGWVEVAFIQAWGSQLPKE